MGGKYKSTILPKKISGLLINRLPNWVSSPATPAPSVEVPFAITRFFARVTANCFDRPMKCQSVIAIFAALVATSFAMDQPSFHTLKSSEYWWKLGLSPADRSSCW
jgi:hypothetical protein